MRKLFKASVRNLIVLLYYRVRGYNLESLFQLSPPLSIWNVPKQLERLCEEEKDRLGELGSGQLDQQPLPPPPRQGA